MKYLQYVENWKVNRSISLDLVTSPRITMKLSGLFVFLFGKILFQVYCCFSKLLLIFFIDTLDTSMISSVTQFWEKPLGLYILFWITGEGEILLDECFPQAVCSQGGVHPEEEAEQGEGRSPSCWAALHEEATGFKVNSQVAGKSVFHTEKTPNEFWSTQCVLVLSFLMLCRLWRPTPAGADQERKEPQELCAETTCFTSLDPGSACSHMWPPLQ